MSNPGNEVLVNKNMLGRVVFVVVSVYMCNRPGSCFGLRFPAEEGYEDAECITFPWVVNKNDLTAEEVADLDAFMKTKYGHTS